MKKNYKKMVSSLAKKAFTMTLSSLEQDVIDNACDLISRFIDGWMIEEICSLEAQPDVQLTGLLTALANAMPETMGTCKTVIRMLERQRFLR